MRTIIEELEKHKESLYKENMIVKEKLIELQEYISENDCAERIYGKDSVRGGIWGRIRNLSNFDEYWRKTVFWKYRQILDLERHIPLDLIEKEFSEGKTVPSHNVRLSIIAYCEMAIQNNNKAFLYLTDPFSEKIIVTSINDSHYYVGSLVHVAAMRNYIDGTLRIMEINKLPYTLFEKDIKSEKEK